MKDITRIRKILSNCKYKGVDFVLIEGEGGYILQVTDFRFYNMERIHPLMRNLKWYISAWSTDTEVVRTAYKAVLNLEKQVMTAISKECIKKIQKTISKLVSDDHSDAAYISEKICKAFRYKNWSLRAQKRDTGYLFQIVFMEKDNADPTKVEMQYCRKWLIENDTISMTYSPEILHVIREAIEAAEIHEINENFLYEGQTIYNPHMNLDGLVDFIKKTPFDERPAPMPPILKMKLSSFEGLSNRTKNIRNQIMHDLEIGELCMCTFREIICIRNVGKNTIKELETLLVSNGLRFGMTMTELSNFGYVNVGWSELYKEKIQLG